MCAFKLRISQDVGAAVMRSITFRSCMISLISMRPLSIVSTIALAWNHATTNIGATPQTLWMQVLTKHHSDSQPPGIELEHSTLHSGNDLRDLFHVCHLSCWQSYRYIYPHRVTIQLGEEAVSINMPNIWGTVEFFWDTAKHYNPSFAKSGVRWKTNYVYVDSLWIPTSLQTKSCQWAL